MKIGIIGGGITGLSAAWSLAKNGHAVTVLERRGHVGGLADAVEIDGATVERYYHFIMTSDEYLLKLIDEMGLSSHLNWVETRTNFFTKDRYYDFSTPFDILKFGAVPFLDRIRFGATMFYLSKINRDWRQLEKINAREWLSKRCGKPIWETIWNPMFRMKFGDHASEISLAWIWARTRMIAQYRPKGAIKEKRAWLRGSLKRLLDALVAAIEQKKGRIICDANIKKIIVENGAATGIVNHAETLQFDKVLYCGSSNDFPDLVDYDDPYFEKIRQQRYFGVICLVMALSESLSDYFWSYVSDERVPFVGVISYSSFTRTKENDGHHIIYIPYYSMLDEEPFSLSDEEIYRRYLAGIKIMYPNFRESMIREYRIMRSPEASMVCRGRYSEQLVPIQSPVKNLYFANLSQIYPQDRGISVGVKLAQYAVQTLEHDTDIALDFAP